MKKKALTLTVVAFLAFSVGSALAQNAEDAKFRKFQDTFWDTYFRLFPTAGTMQGYAKYSDRLEDLSQAAIEKFLESVDGFNQELVTKIDKFKLSPDVQVEQELMRDFLDLQVLKLENSLFLIDNPLFYNDLFVNSIRSLIVRNPGSPSAAARAKLLPGLIRRAKENLKTPPQEYTQAAINQLPGIIDFYRTEVPQIAGSAPGLLVETQKVLLALDDYQRFLQNELLPRSTGNFRNPEAHGKIVRFMTKGNLSIQADIVARSTSDVKNIRNAMGEICIPYFKIMYPTINPDQLAAQKGVDFAVTSVIQGVLDKLKVNHVGKDEYIGRIGQAAANLKGFIQQTKLLELPDVDVQIVPMPAYMYRGLWFHLTRPGAFETTGPYILYARAIPADWPADSTTSFLEERNNFYMDFMTVQRVFPGSFVPAYFTRKDPSVIKRIAGNQALLVGWPVYVEGTFILGGYSDYDLRMRLHQLKLLLKTVIDFQMDMNIHQGTYAKEKVVDYMMRYGFMGQTEAEGHWNKIVLNPGEGSLPYIGYQEIQELEKDYRKLKGDAFNQKEFLQRILSYGSAPFPVLKAKLAQ
jgi:hypothetical protein